MTKIGTWMAAACIAAMTTMTATPARAGDVCVQFAGAGCDLSGDLGFFRLLGAKFPSSNKKAVKVSGRACATGSVTGTLVMSHDSTRVHFGATFDCDAVFGALSADFDPASLAVGSTAATAWASYGDVALGSSCTATVVDCATEP